VEIATGEAVDELEFVGHEGTLKTPRRPAGGTGMERGNRYSKCRGQSTLRQFCELQ
jgi:hypothetical protein